MEEWNKNLHFGYGAEFIFKMGLQHASSRVARRDQVCPPSKHSITICKDCNSELEDKARCWFSYFCALTVHEDTKQYLEGEPEDE